MKLEEKLGIKSSSPSGYLAFTLRGPGALCEMLSKNVGLGRLEVKESSVEIGNKKHDVWSQPTYGETTRCQIRPKALLCTCGKVVLDKDMLLFFLSCKHSFPTSLISIYDRRYRSDEPTGGGCL